MILESIANTSSVLLIRDSSINCIPIILHLLKNDIKYQETYFICTEKPVESYKRFITSPQVNFIDAFGKDPDIPVFNNKSVVILDSISHLALSYTRKKTLSLLNSLVNVLHVKKLISIFNRNNLSEGDNVLPHIKYLHKMLIELTPSNKNIHLEMKYNKGGKMVKFEEDLQMDYKTEKLQAVKIEHKVLKKEAESSVLPHSVASFRIGLTEDEIRVRDSVQLPYMTKGTGQIIYTPDAADDWDEEDPDDDLDI